ncbi:Dihydroorotate dehydrogenase, catalytic subunit [Fructilactobacillus florum 8D]|uniref:dihydroorotate oxidase (fumarate) n=1 Tax=Fructilactobacillus florum 8D TaxID=1221538 RepID=W9EDL8_9LACO|nr:dihydroorotate oxidase [Fructilactobacillus florum]EKK20148.1 Dihydroorotate dehydrogenase, catalytic subunit [Fructilactobacillus florum 2F]ETO40223.1 Dihydroorotate dehydrogenase, catalytic subunit [Fructilactobacillus florum 8D]
MKIDLSTTIGPNQFSNPLINAAGVWDETALELDELVASTAGGVTTKSATLEPRSGNQRPRYADVALGSINSMGLPNQGLKYYLNYVTTHDASKPIDLSIANPNPMDNLTALQMIQDSSFQGLTELNLSCPNVIGKPQIGYDLAALKQILQQAFKLFTKPLGIKLPPYFDLQQFDAVADILNQFPLTFINTINSVGNGLLVDPTSERTLIEPKGGFGGIGGAYVKPVALANVHAFRSRLKPTIKIIGTGGVRNGTDVFELILCGADAVSVGTTLMQAGPQLFTKLQDELIQLMVQKHYPSLATFRNQLKAAH